jgi:hypothetical protein
MSDLVRLAIGADILSWTSTSVLAGLPPTPYQGFQGIKFEEKRERKIVYGMNKAGMPIGQTGGKYTAGPGSIKMLADTWKTMSLALAITGLGSYGDAKFPMVVKYEEPLDPTGITIISFDTCTISGVSDDLSEGNDENTVDVSFSCLGITRNGVTLYSRVGQVGL